MIVYAVTVHVDEAAAPQWEVWMREVHIPDVLATGCFAGHQFFRVLEPGIADKSSYAVHYLCPDRAAYARYLEEHAPRLQADHIQRYEGKFTASRMLLEDMG